jgi:hypothetical protein
VDVDNLRRALWYFTDGGVTPWGWVGEREAYMSFYTVGAWPRAIIFARFGGENQFVTNYYYNLINMILYSSYPSGPKHESAHFASEINPITHHAGNGDHRGMHTLLLKYMYPDDPAVDYMFASRASGRESRMNGPSLEACLFAIDPDIKNTKGQLEAVAEKKALPLTKLDPEEGVVVFRNDWKDDTLLVDFDCGFEGGGHMDAEKNSFSLYALGRDWAISPGFHKIYSNWHSGIHFQEPAWAACKYTQGYVGLHPCYKPAVDSCDMPPNFPTPPGKLLEVTEGPDHQYALVAGDATAAYNYLCGGADAQRVAINRSEYMFPGLLPDLLERVPIFQKVFVESLSPHYGFKDRSVSPYAPTTVDHAIRTLFVARGKHPYVLVVDDFKKEDKPRNYRWMMCNDMRTEADWSGWPKKGDLSLMIEPGATSTEGVLFHKQDSGSKPGLPRLLVRDVSEADNSNQPPIRIDTTQFDVPKGLEKDFYLKHQAARLFIERQQVVEPNYKVLLFPFRTGEKLPVTKWNDKKTELTVDLQDGTVDTIRFDTNNPDHRTRISFQRNSVRTP